VEALLGAGVAGVGLWLARLEPFVALLLLALAFVALAVGFVAVAVALALGSLAAIQIGSRSITCRATACNHSGEGKVVLSRAARIITRQ
jgi:hypothetical protein